MNDGSGGTMIALMTDDGTDKFPKIGTLPTPAPTDPLTAITPALISSNTFTINIPYSFKFYRLPSGDKVYAWEDDSVMKGLVTSFNETLPVSNLSEISLNGWPSLNLGNCTSLTSFGAGSCGSTLLSGPTPYTHPLVFSNLGSLNETNIGGANTTIFTPISTFKQIGN